MNAIRDRPHIAPRTWLLAGAIALVVAAAAWATWGSGSLPGWAAGSLGFALALALAHAAGYFLGRRQELVLHQAIRRALQGHLEPADTDARATPGSAVSDYNVLARRLRSLFEEMERSQLWIIGERNRNDAILRGLPCVMLAVDDDLCITLSNDRAEELFAASGTPNLRGSNLFDILKPDDEGRTVLREAFLYEQHVVNREIALGEGESRRHFSLSITFFKTSPEARDASAVIMLQDITDLRRLQEISSQSEKFVAMGQLAGGVAHELNTPLGTIVGYAQLLKAGTANDSRRTEYARIIYEEAKRCARIIDNLLAYARRERCAPETCDINALIRDVVETTCNCRANRFNVPIEVDLRDHPLVLGGAGKLDIVLVNVLMNALQATSGAVENPRVVIASRTEEDSAVVTITDNGPGVPDGLRSRVFDPFFSTKGSNKGTGLGLAISQSIVLGIGGTLHCDANFRDGARFVLKLPLANAGPDERCANA